MTTVRDELQAQRVDAVRAWTAFVEGGDGDEVRPEILSSWQRSGSAITPDVAEAPMADEDDTRTFYAESPLSVAVSRIEEELRRTADDGDLVLAVTDADTRILWTYGGRVMRRKAESVNFVAGGRWGETAVGTNALALANVNAKPSMVFSAEHFAPIVHNWVCWAAPVHDPVTGEQLGVIDLSTTWDRTHPIGLATARVMARLLENALPTAPPIGRRRGAGASLNAGLELTLLGRVEVVLDGQRLLVTRRQSEILALLALHPDGLSLEQMHALLYGDAAVTTSTLKAEISHLRSALGGQLASRPYRLMMPVDTDVDRVLDLLRAGETDAAVEAFGGDLLPGTTSPALAELADFVAVAVREALLARPTPGAVLRYSSLAPYDTEVVEVALASLPERHPARPLLLARLASSRA
ncbi:transcriptional regulator [Nocardioides iriomotensis]|uniref:Transcriptional regulator n=1 Tax=Nocardioides iriomotensis TaxID=715784 RepID=A0A4Q5J4Q4_9ACTN|nr:transcriptional regulator [Nocardioides iriomotensis]RYU13453.1 transcriptional regulator [Nocardioides iriomotensis]